MVPGFSFLFIISLLYIEISFNDFLLFGILNSFLTWMGVFISQANIYWQMAYFHIVCYYCYLKMRLINDQIKESIDKMQIHRVSTRRMIQNLSSVYNEIARYNKHWSRFTAGFNFLMTTFIGTITYAFLYGRLNPFIQFLLFSCISFFCVLFSLYMCSGALIPSEVKKSYKLLNNFYLNLNHLSIRRRFKVIFALFLYLYFIIYYRKIMFFNIELLVFMERLGKEKVAFYCWILFRLTYFRFAEV